ncbi:hypothetical protein RJ527_18655 [Thalassospiraceae bacterium LMO-SO8]|jgi:hypothetical protein|nr:hypothetical protein [Alphaproteobacteria bacterium LMO-S08]WND76028.1 hypothetical protein RJ527_18655 [Thalassospiraceae bacterium LMO-SO8]
MRPQLLVYVSRNDPECFVVTPTHLAHQAHVDFYWSASDDQLSLVPRERAREVLERLGCQDAEVSAIDESGPFCHAA